MWKNSRISTRTVVMLRRCCYMDMRHGKKCKLTTQSCRPSLNAACDESWTFTGRKWFQMKCFGKGEGKSRCPRRSIEKMELDRTYTKERIWILRKRDLGLEPAKKRRTERPRHAWRRTVHSDEISPIRCNKCVFILRNGFTLHVSGDNLTHQEYICCIWPQVSRLT